LKPSNKIISESKKRKESRIKREKDEELERFRDTVERNVIFKGEVNEVLKSNLLDIHGNYVS
jgi:ribosomal protein S13